MNQHRRFNAQRFYREVKFHLIEIGSIVSLAIVLYKVIRREW
jgi:hypothetical protein